MDFVLLWFLVVELIFLSFFFVLLFLVKDLSFYVEVEFKSGPYDGLSMWA